MISVARIFLAFEKEPAKEVEAANEVTKNKEPGLPEVFQAFGSIGCQIRLISAFFQKIRLAAIL